MSAWRCTTCDLNWPYHSQWSRCGVCAGQCEASPVTSLSIPAANAIVSRARLDRSAEAEKRTKIREFEDHYAEREVATLRAALDGWLEMEVA